MPADATPNHYSYAQLMTLWEQAGGSKLNAAMAAAIAMAESGGDATATNNNTNGTQDRGLWQVNSSWGSLSTFDPMSNARAAVQISKNGTTWRPWCTAYSDALCGSKGGTYLGAGSPFLKFLNPSENPGSTINTGVNTTANTGSSQYAAFPATQNAAWYDWILPGPTWLSNGGGTGALNDIFGIPLGGFAQMIESGISSAIMDVLKPVGRLLLHTGFVVGGVVMMAYALNLMVKDAGITGSASVVRGGGTSDEAVGAIEEFEDEGEGEGQGQTGGGRSGKGQSGVGGSVQSSGGTGTAKRPGRTQKLVEAGELAA